MFPYGWVFIFFSFFFFFSFLPIISSISYLCDVQRSVVFRYLPKEFPHRDNKVVLICIVLYCLVYIYHRPLNFHLTARSTIRLIGGPNTSELIYDTYNNDTIIYDTRFDWSALPSSRYNWSDCTTESDSALRLLRRRSTISTVCPTGV